MWSRLRRPTVQIVGDGLDGQWLSWRWAGTDRPVGVHRCVGLDAALAALDAALPGGDPTSLDDQRLTGPLADATAERELMRLLAGALLPERLVAELLAQRERVEVRVLPSPRLARVPWGLLPVAGDRRLIELADVSWIGPLLPRDVAEGPAVGPDDAAPPTERRDRPPEDDADLDDAAPPLYVLDPLTRHGAVLPAGYVPCAPGGADVEAVILTGCADERPVLDWLRDGVSRLFLLGHAVHAAGRPGEVEFLFARGRLNAADLIFADWRAPARAAIVACASGTDLADVEPLGLATALLLRGAELVQGTLWPLPTDAALAREDEEAHGVFAELVAAFDRAQGAADPVAELCGFQRRRLADWRARPTLGNSPILWGSATTITAPRRRSLAGASHHRNRQAPGPPRAERVSST
ncbi:CHAT domain-containing protein [Tessaracoccus sp. OH4464_COT-324]|uniref:CHAT domain-containing protein n=1 Tax=Tessaracoccus sp. OH4464_COT-324 TaxID=2491059 RepID=UPI00131A0E2E|nr:CHAT domain-containing protein [Tessaracoccus sp. OH4464_COT-324]